MTNKPSSSAGIAAMCKALGDPTRLRILEFLRSCCCPVAVDETGEVRRTQGPTAGEVCCRARVELPGCELGLDAPAQTWD